VTSFFRRPSLGFGIAALSALLLLPAGLRAQDDQSGAPREEAPQLSDSTGDGLAKLDPLIKAKDWEGSIKLVDSLLQEAKPDSYDQCFLSETEAQIYTQKGDYLAAITPLETSLQIADRHHYFNNKQETDMLYFLSQLYYQQADLAKSDRGAQVSSLEKAIAYMDRWFAASPKPNEDISVYYAQLLYSAAVAADPSHPDPVLLGRARQQFEKVLRMSVHPKDSLYIYLLAIIQQQLDYAHAAEYFELLLSRNPNNRSYWQDLSTLYMALAQDPKDKDERAIRKYNIRAINTFERAQALGFLKAPRDNFTLFTLYYNIGEYGMAADLLHNGLKTGTIDPELSNYLLLAASYQQINQDFTAIEVLKEAAERYPTNGEIEFKIAQVYQQLDDNKSAYEHTKVAVEKGHLAKAQQTYLLLSYMAYEVGNFDDAKEAIDKAIELSNGKPDHQALGLRTAIEDAIKERDAKKDTPPDKI
jgi:tetratricopeptide (TPR) repeat protein